jgi:hypothetical protein
MKNLFQALVAMCAMSMASGVSASVILNEVGGTLVGASNVQVGDFLYDVNFVDGSCAGLFDGCNDTSDFDFQTLDDAVAAGFGLLDQVFVGRFDTDWFDTFGCAPNSINGGECHVAIPFSAPPTTNILNDPTRDHSSAVVYNKAVTADRATLVTTLAETISTTVDFVSFSEGRRNYDYTTASSPCHDDCSNATTFARFVQTGPASVPEPTTTALLALGLLVAGRGVRRCQRQVQHTL